MTIQELRPLDVICSWKKSKGLFGPLFDWGILRAGRKQYPLGNVRYNHVRISLGLIGGVQTGFSFEWPAAHFVRIEPWMIEPTYGHVFRRKNGWDGIDDVLRCRAFDTCLPYDGAIYDLGELLDEIAPGSPFDFGKRNRVCSTGARVIQEKAGRVKLFPEIGDKITLPCAWPNSVEWVRVN
jgi:hypothetical protein